MNSQHGDWFDDASTIMAPSRESINSEVEDMALNMRKVFKEYEQAVIGVVRSEAVAHVKNRLKLAWWKRVLGKKVKDYPLLVTTVEQLQDVVETIRKKFKHCKVLTILVSAEIDALYPFNVGSRIQTLRIFRCSSDEFRDGVLLIPGNSTFNRISLGRWQEKARNRHKLLLGTNVGVKVDSNWHAPAASSNELTEDQKEALKTYLEAMQKGGKHKKWWNEWKGPVAAILGLVVTTGQIAMDLKVAAGGAFVSFECAAFSLQTGAAWFQASTVTTVMGPAVLLGVGVAAAVYFIPWGDLISWIRGLVSSLSSWFVSLWGEFLSWLSKCQEEIQTRSSRLKSSY